MDRGRRTLEKSSKMQYGALKSLAGALLLIVISSPAFAGDGRDESDRIEFVVGNRVYVVPNVEQRLREYNAFLVDWRFAPTPYSSRRQPRAGEKRGFHGGETLSHFEYFD